MLGVAESGDDFTKFSTSYQWFQTLIHPALMQRRILFYLWWRVMAITSSTLSSGKFPKVGTISSAE
ncbi:MAG: hypothetical protein HRU34_11760 [Richelia sp.]|nr:hypothetical protein [Richelia sp.]